MRHRHPDAKAIYQRERPGEADPSLTTVVVHPCKSGIRPECSNSSSSATVLSLPPLPEGCAQRFADKADEASRCSRVLAGVQYPSDVVAGEQLGRAVASLATDRARQDGSDA